MSCKSPLMVSLSIRQQGTLLDYGSHVVAACTSLNASQQNMFVFKKWLMNSNPVSNDEICDTIKLLMISDVISKYQPEFSKI